eukprot:TRINITY_DN11880_c0_g1_i1.p1 TRINITY_DN11880_c0_g1~~TRINITY_DN11880_c0_g1_i1.p1  ORF type:complete len:193 (+),score=33.57 TRINITY_DN11880_c0_g1_i1:70-648(+)
MGSYNYYDVHQILAEQEQVTLTFPIGAHQLGFLDPSSVGADLARDKKVELPLWLSLPLSQRNMVAVESQKIIGPKFRSALSADPTVINLHDRSSYFYQICADVAQLTSDQTIMPLLRTCFTERYKIILDKCLNSLSTDSSDFTRKLTQSERTLFQAGVVASSDFHSWRQRRTEKITASRTIENDRSKKLRLA